MKFPGNESHKIKKNDNINRIHDHIKQNFLLVVLVCMGLHKCDNITRLITLSMITINGDCCIYIYFVIFIFIPNNWFTVKSGRNEKSDLFIIVLDN